VAQHIGNRFEGAPSSQQTCRERMAKEIKSSSTCSAGKAGTLKRYPHDRHQIIFSSKGFERGAVAKKDSAVR
jgi:hypothetical protein